VIIRILQRRRKMKEPVSTGAEIPDFTLKDQDGNDFRFSQARGRKILLSFHPLDWTEV